MAFVLCHAIFTLVLASSSSSFDLLRDIPFCSLAKHLSKYSAALFVLIYFVAAIVVAAVLAIVFFALRLQLFSASKLSNVCIKLLLDFFVYMCKSRPTA